MNDHPERSHSASGRKRKLPAALSSDFGKPLSGLFRETLRKKAFDNRFTLHPRRLDELASEIVDEFKTFSEKSDAPRAHEFGRRLAAEGLSQRLLSELAAIMRQYLGGSPSEVSKLNLQGMLRHIDSFAAALMDGYVEAREEQILKDQQQLRLALSTALERQRRELHVKNHAIHTSINGIVLCELEGRITYVNPAALRLWGLTGEQELLGRPCAELLGADGNYIMDKTRSKGSWQGELSVSRKDGQTFELAVSASVILDESNEPAGVIAFFYDVTERKRLESQFRQSQKMEALGQLAGGIVHDFNNLLAAISGYTQLALMDVPKDSKLYQDFLQIKTATDRGKELTQELRLFTRQASSKKEVLNPNTIVDETYKLLLRTFPPEVKIDLSLDPQVRWVRANPSQVGQVVMNLCMNARDAILSRLDHGSDSRGGARSRGELTLRTRNVDLEWHTAALFLAARPGKYVCISVEDTGMGIPTELMDRLFEPFFTTKGESGGTGLGLAVVFGIVKSHEGFIDVQSREGSGSTFTVYLPCVEESEHETAEEEYAPDLTAGKGSVLVVEDNPQVQGMMIRALEESGYRVYSAKNGIDAVALYRKHGKLLNLVVLDMIMPQMGGRECFYRLKKINPEVKVLIVTGFTTDGSVEDFLEEGARGIMTKPFELQAFTETVQRIIREK